MNWAPVLELLPEAVALVLLLLIVELRARVERARRETREAKQEVAAVRVELDSLRPPKEEP